MDKDVINKYQEIKNSVEHLRGQLAEITRMANEELKEYGADYVEEISVDVDKAMNVARQKSREAKEFISGRPWTTMAVVSLTMLVAGLLLGHSKCRQK